MCVYACVHVQEEMNVCVCVDVHECACACMSEGGDDTLHVTLC